MDLWQTVRMLGRRWYIAIPAFLAVVGIAGVMAVSLPRVYESTGTVVLVQPGGTGENSSNPMLSFADSLTTTSELIIQSLNSASAQHDLLAQGATGTFTASDGMLQGPFVVVIADASSPAAAEHTVAVALQNVTQQLDERQRILGAPLKSYIFTKSVVAPTPAVLKIGGKSRLALSTVVLAFSAALTAAGLFETYRGRKRARAAADKADKDNNDNGNAGNTDDDATSTMELVR